MHYLPDIIIIAVLSVLFLAYLALDRDREPKEPKPKCCPSSSQPPADNGKCSQPH